MITFENVSKSFGDVQVLHNLSFTIDRSERVSLIGASGSGKTTILRILMTLERPSEGRVLVGGEALWDCERDAKWSHRQLQGHLKKMRNKIGMVFQQFNLFPNMTAVENIANTLQHVRRLDKPASYEQASALLKLVGMSERGTSYPHQLSGGQQQRVAIARALSLKPEIMLFDEVTSALDPELVGEVLNVLRDLATATEMTMLLVTHEMNFAKEISDRVMMFDSGSIIESGPPAQIFTNPAEERTRQFLKSVVR